MADRQKLTVIALMALVFATALLWASFSGDVPDEDTYFMEIMEAATTGAVSQRSTHPAVVFTWAGVLFVKLFGIFGVSPLLAVRLLGVLCVTGCGYVAYRAAQEAFPAWPHAQLAAIVLVTFNPMFMFIGASANSDTALNLFGALVFWGLVVLLRRGFSVQAIVLVVAGFLLGALTKERIWLLAPAVPLALFMRYSIDVYRRRKSTGGVGTSEPELRSQERHGRWKTRKTLALGAVLLIGATAGVFSRQFIEAVYHRPIQLGVWFFGELAPAAQVVDWVVQKRAWLLGTSWANFGMLVVWAPRWIYRLLDASLGLAILGFVTGLLKRGVAAVRTHRVGNMMMSPGAHMMLLSLITFLVAVYAAAQYELSVGLGAQGRYLFVVAVPVALLLLRGFFGAVPISRHHLVATALIIIMFLSNAFCLWYVLAPSVY